MTDHTDRVVAVSPSDATVDSSVVPSLDVSFSGGGLRAAYFSLGVTLYLIDNNLRQQVRSISSVSGGSILNMALAVGGDFAAGDLGPLKQRLQRLAVRLAKQGSFFVRPIRAGVAAGVATAALLVAIPAALAGLKSGETIPERIESIASDALPPAAIVAFISLVLFWLLRGPVQRRTYANVIKELHQDSAPWHDEASNFVAGLPETEVCHVFCATELVSGTPMYMSRRWSHCPAYGSGKPSHLRLSEVLYASAAFPIAFPPLKVRVNDSEWSGGTEVDRPSTLWLADGGIYNNLGTEWRKDLSAALQRDHEAAFELPPCPSHQVVINASSPATVANIGWFLRRVRQFFRMISIMYENTVRLRIDVALEDRSRSSNAIVIDIKESPLVGARRIHNASSGLVRSRVEDSLAFLERMPDHYWHKYNIAASRVKTTLDAVGPRQAAQLLRHAYLSAAVTCSAYLDSAGVETVPRQQQFFQFVSGESAWPAPDSAAQWRWQDGR